MSDLRSLSRRLARIGAAVAPPPLHPGILVVFRSCDGTGHPLPLPAGVPPYRTPEARDPRDGLDVVWVGEDGAELSRWA